MIYLTGDLHGNPTQVELFCNKMQLTEKDVIVLLGDVGANYYTGKRDRLMKRILSVQPVTFLCIHGNHEIRPQNIPDYHPTIWNGGRVFVSDEFPNILFAEDGEVYDLDGKKALAIGGAYSVDKFYRLERGFGWWADEPTLRGNKTQGRSRNRPRKGGCRAVTHLPEEIYSDRNVLTDD